MYPRVVKFKKEVEDEKKIILSSFNQYIGNWNKTTGKKSGHGFRQLDIHKKFFIFGGDDGIHENFPSNRSFVFSPSNAQGRSVIEYLKPMPKPISVFSTIHHEQYIFIIGGYDGQRSCSNIFRYDLLMNDWLEMQPLRYRRASSCSVLVQDKIFIIGGVCGSKVIKEIEEYNIMTNEIKIVASLNFGRSGCQSILLNQKVYIFGGIQNTTEEKILPFEIFDLNSHRVEILEQVSGCFMSFGASHFSINSKDFILFGGGSDSFGNPSKKVYLFDVCENQLQEVDALQNYRRFTTFIKMDHFIYAIGGFNGKVCISEMERYNILTKKWNKVSPYHFCPFCGEGIVFINNFSIRMNTNYRQGMLVGTSTFKIIQHDKVYHFEGKFNENQKTGKYVYDSGKIIYFEQDRPINIKTKQSLQKLKHLKIPNEYLCPISKEIMKDPVINEIGYTYEKYNIETWYGVKQSDPVTNLPITNVIVIPNLVLKTQIKEFYSQNELYL